MKSNLKSRNNTEAKVQISLDAEGLAPIVALAYDQLRKQVKAKGFRPGHAPNAIVERELGSAQIQNEVIEQAVTQSYAVAVKEHKLPVIAQPNVQIAKFIPFEQLEYEVTVELMPEITIPDLSKINITKNTAEISDAEIELVVRDLRLILAKKTPSKNPAKIGDELIVDFAGYTPEKALIGPLTTENYRMILGNSQLTDDFDKQLLGTSPDQEIEFETKLPDDKSFGSYATRLVLFKVKIKSLNHLELPELNDKFAKSFGPHPTLQALKDDIKDSLHAEKMHQIGADFDSAVAEAVIDRAKIELPPSLMKAEIDGARHELEHNLKAKGETLEQYLEDLGMDETKLTIQLTNSAKKRLTWALILSKVAEQENLTTTAPEITEYIAELTQRYPKAASQSDFQSEINSEEGRKQVYNRLIAAKAQAVIVRKISQNGTK